MQLFSYLESVKTTHLDPLRQIMHLSFVCPATCLTSGHTFICFVTMASMSLASKSTWRYQCKLYRCINNMSTFRSQFSGMSISPIVNKMSTPTREANFQRHLADKKKAQLFPRHPKAVANDFEAFFGMVRWNLVTISRFWQPIRSSRSISNCTSKQLCSSVLFI